MYRKKANQHKLKRKFVKLVKKDSTSLSSGRKKYLIGGSGANPYKVNKNFDKKRKIEIYIFVGILFLILWFFLYHSFFKISKIHISGLDRIEETEIKEAVRGVLNYKKFFIFPGDSYVMTNLGDIKGLLLEKYPIKNLKVEKNFPNKINIVLEEKISTIIYDNGTKYSYLSPAGNIIEILENVTEREWFETFDLVTTTLADGTIREEKINLVRYHEPSSNRIRTKFGTYPILYDSRNKEVDINTKMVPDYYALGTIDWFNFLELRSEIDLDYIESSGDRGEATLYLVDGRHLKINLRETSGQIEEMQYILQKGLDTDFLEYVDLRFKDKIYWK